MRSDPINPDLTAILEHVEWVRDLAGRLVHDPHVADDLAQEAMLVALRGGASPRSWRAWFRGVIANLLSERRRTGERRQRRETAAAPREALESTVSLVAEASMHRKVVDTVLGLPEHYRDALLLRYYRGLTPTEIARQLGAPIATVKTRLQRGLERMRQDLDVEHGGDRRAWVLALAPLLPVRPSPVPSQVLPTWLALKSVAALLLIGVGGGALLWWSAVDRSPTHLAGSGGAMDRGSGPGSDSLASVEGATRDDEGPSLDRPTADLPDAGPIRLLQPTAAGLESDGAALAPRRARLEGRALNTKGQPATGLVVRYQPFDVLNGTALPGTSVAVTDGEGHFRLDVAVTPGRVFVATQGHFTWMTSQLATEAEEVVLVVTPARALAGQVVDEDGRPLAGAVVEIEPPERIRTHLARELARCSTQPLWQETDAEGRFAFEAVPADDDATLRVGHPAYEESRTSVASYTGEARVELAAATDAEPLRGRVFDQGGVPVPGARVAWGSQTAVSSADGAFTLSRDDVPLRRQPLTAVAAGHLPASVWPDEDGDGDHFAEPLELHLGGAPRSLSLQIVDDRGRGRPGLWVWVEDPTLLHHAPQAPDDSSSTRPLRCFTPDELPRLVENELAGVEGRVWNYQVTDEGGHVLLEGLTEREYLVAAMNPATLQRQQWPDLTARADTLSLTFPETDDLADLSGRVVDHQGRPVADVRVGVRTRGLLIRDGTRTLFSQIVSGRSTRTDAHGEFRLPRVPSRHVTLSLEGDAILTREVPLDEGLQADGRRRLVVTRRVRLQVHLSDPERADRVSFHDRDDRRLTVERRQGDSRFSDQFVNLVEGRSEVLHVPDVATHVVLWSEGGRVDEVPLQWNGAALQVLEL